MWHSTKELLEFIPSGPQWCWVYSRVVVELEHGSVILMKYVTQTVLLPMLHLPPQGQFINNVAPLRQMYMFTYRFHEGYVSPYSKFVPHVIYCIIKLLVLKVDQTFGGSKFLLGN